MESIVKPLYRDFTTREQLDAQYDTSRQVADLGALMEGRRALSDRARQQLVHHRDLRYGDRPEERLDLFPASRPDAPLIVFIHGGYWSTQALIKDLYAWTALGPYAHGAATAVLDYGVCPEYKIGELVTQCRNAIAWLYANAARYGVSSENVYVVGHSAGGHLAAMLALTDWDARFGLPADAIKGICPISGLFDLAPFPHTWLQPKLRLTTMDIAENSPILLPGPLLVPALITLGADETPEFHRQAASMHERYTELGVASRLLALDGCLHNSAIDGLSDPDSQLMLAIVETLLSCTVKDA